MKKLISAILVCVLIVGMLTGCGKNKVTMDEILADTNMVVGTIEGQDVYAYEFIYYLKQGATVDQVKDVVLQTKVLKNIGKENGIDYTDEMQTQVDEFINSGVEQHSSKEEFESVLLENGGVTVDQYSALYKESLLVQEVVNKVLELGVIKEATDDEVRAFFDQYCLKAKHILFKTVSDDGATALSEEELKTKYAKAEETLAAINGGSDFDSFAELNEDPGAAQSPDGYVFVNTSLIEDEVLLSTVQQAGLAMVPEFEQATAALEPGKVSGIVSSNYGHHIIKRIALTDDDFSANQDMLKNLLSGLNFNKYMEEAEANAPTEWNDSAITTLSENVKPVQQLPAEQAPAEQ